MWCSLSTTSYWCTSCIGFESSHDMRHILKHKKTKRYLDSLNIYSLNHKSIAQRMKTVQEDCLKVCKTYCDKRKKTQCKDQTFNINMEKKLNVWKHDISRIKKLKTKYDMKVNDDEKKTYIKATVMVDTWLNILMLLIVHGQKIFKKRKTYKINYQTERRNDKYVSNNSRSCFWLRGFTSYTG